MLLFLFFLFIEKEIKAQHDTLKHFFLGEISITADREPESEIILRNDISTIMNQPELSSAIAEIPGVSPILTGSRNEKSVLIRGFDSRQFTVFVDGIPVYISYDGTMDLGRFLSWNYEKVKISKSFTSLLYGMNTMGGAINLITRIPENDVEVRMNTGLYFGNNGYEGNQSNYSLGGKNGNFVFQTNLSRYKIDGWSVSNNSYLISSQESRLRNNSYEEDFSLGFRIGFIGDKGNRFLVSYTKHEGQKGIPGYKGEYQPERYWQMPDWDKETLSMISEIKTGNNSQLRLRLYYDSFFNFLKSYDDSTYTNQNTRYAFSSKYNDHSMGISSEYKLDAAAHKFGVAFGMKNDFHSEQANTGSLFTKIRDYNVWFAVEDNYSPWQKTDLVAGISVHQRSNTLAEGLENNTEIIEIPSRSHSAFNYRVGVFYTMNTHHRLWSGFAFNSRFPTMKERYSFRLGRSIPNPDLKPEYASHMTAGYDYHSNTGSINIEIFYVRAHDRISYITPEPGLIQYQNIEKSYSLGADISYKKTIIRALIAGVNYSYIYITNPDNDQFYFVDIPAHSGNVWIRGIFPEKLNLKAEYQVLSGRYSYSDESIKTDGFGLINLQLQKSFKNNISVATGINNLFDNDYFYSDGYPGRGRYFYFSVGYELYK